MSEEQLKAFIAKVQSDTSLQEQLKAEGADVVAIAKAAGFAITTEDLNSKREDLSDYEMSYDELEGVAAGVTINDTTAPSAFRISKAELLVVGIEFNNQVHRSTTSVKNEKH